MGAQGPRPYVVVVGIDYSDVAAEALERAFEMASHQEKAEVHAVNVVRNFGEFVLVESPQPSVYGVSLREATDRLATYVEEKRRLFEARLGRSACARCVTHLRSESPAEEITALAAELTADLVVVGTHGRRGVRRLVLGSVAESVVRLADCPVLVVRPRRSVEEEPVERGQRARESSPLELRGRRDYPHR